MRIINPVDIDIECLCVVFKNVVLSPISGIFSVLRIYDVLKTYSRHETRRIKQKSSHIISWTHSHQISAGSEKIEKDRNWGIEKDKTFLSLPTHHFPSPKLYLFLSPHLSRVTGNIYLFLSLCLVISIFSYPSVYPQTK